MGKKSGKHQARKNNQETIGYVKGLPFPSTDDFRFAVEAHGA